MISIHVSGNLFRVGDQPKTIVTRTSFCLLGHYQAGSRDKAKRWLDRIQAQGFDGPRLFGENQDWFGLDSGPFFGTGRTPRIRAFEDYSGPLSQLELIDGYEALVTQLAEDLISRNMIAEFCCVATIKGREAGWTGQGLNKFAQMFRGLFPDPNDTPFLHETINEWDAHSTLAKDPDEITRMGSRWRRTHADAEKHNYPGSTIGVSAGGQWKPGFDDYSYTHRNIHPTRGANWMLGERSESLELSVRRLIEQGGGRPVYLNETVHYMTKGQWDEWIPKVPKWAGLSTTDHGRLAEYVLDIRRFGASVNFHDLVGMSTDPDAPITIGEEAIAAALGGAAPAPVPVPVPVPPAPVAIDRAVQEIVLRGYSDILFRVPDPGGFDHYCQMILDGASEARFREILLRARLGGAR